MQLGKIEHFDFAPSDVPLVQTQVLLVQHKNFQDSDVSGVADPLLRLRVFVAGSRGSDLKAPLESR